MSRPGGHGFRTEKQESPERPRSPGPRALPLEAGGPPNQETQPNPGCGSQVDQGPRPQRQGARAHTWANVPIGQVQDDAHCPVLQEVLPLSCWVQNGTAVGTATLPAPKRCSLPARGPGGAGPACPFPRSLVQAERLQPSPRETFCSLPRPGRGRFRVRIAGTSCSMQICLPHREVKPRHGRDPRVAPGD